MERLITSQCYEKIKALYIEKGFPLYPFPINYIPGFNVGGVAYRSIAFRDDDIRTPPEVDEMWEYGW